MKIYRSFPAPWKASAGSFTCVHNVLQIKYWVCFVYTKLPKVSQRLTPVSVLWSTSHTHSNKKKKKNSSLTWYRPILGTRAIYSAAEGHRNAMHSYLYCAKSLRHSVSYVLCHRWNLPSVLLHPIQKVQGNRVGDLIWRATNEACFRGDNTI